MRVASFRLFYFAIGQHYSYNVDWVFFEQLKLPDAKYNLDVGSGLYGKTDWLDACGYRRDFAAGISRCGVG
jgi:hypothetical protein